MNRRLLAILIIIIAVVLIAALLVVYINSQDSGASDGPPPTVQLNESGTPINEQGTPLSIDPNAPIGVDGGISAGTPLPPMVEVVVSLQTVPRGWQLTENELTTDMRLASSVPSNVITDIQDAVGRYVRTDMFQGETLTIDSLVEDPTVLGATEYGPSHLIPENFVAAAIPIDRLSSVGYIVGEGDYVDIMLTFAFYKIDPEFQTLLPNDATFTFDRINEDGSFNNLSFDLTPYGRFEELPTGATVHVIPSETDQRPVAISVILQNAKVIQVGEWRPELPPQLPTATPTPNPDEEGTPTPQVAVNVTPTPVPPSVVVLALQPQQQLFLKYALEANADVDLALRGVNDAQLYPVDYVDLPTFLSLFDIQPPIDYEYSVNPFVITVTPPSEPIGDDGSTEPDPANDPSDPSNS